MNVAHWLYSKALTHPDAPALITGTTQNANYEEFANSAVNLAEHLRKTHAIQQGDRVAIYMANRIEYLIVMYAVWWLGAVIVPINYRLHAKEAEWILRNSEATILFTDTGSLFNVNQLPKNCTEIGVETKQYQQAVAPQKPINKPLSLESNSLAWIFYTSGTTGRPKGVMLSHNNLMSMTLCYPMDVDPVSACDASVYAAPLSHGAGLYNLVFVRIGARHVVPESRGFDSKEILNIAKTLRSATMFAAPTMIKRLVTYAKANKEDGDGIKSIVFGGAPMYVADLIEALDTLGPRFIQIYGQGESPMTITSLQRDLITNRNHPEWEKRLTSVGLAHSCIEIKIVDENLKDVANNVSGEIIVRGATIMQGYWRNPEATKETLINGWLHTGDIGYLNENGFLTLTDRSKDVIISGGSNIYPREVEEVLTNHPAVFEVAVVGAPHPDWGEEVVAFVVSKTSEALAYEEMDRWCKEHIASFKKPKRYIFCSELPKNSYGKVIKTELRKQLAT